MSNVSLSGRTTCFAPFLPLSDYSESVGFLPGRFCADLGTGTCCIPCPKTDYLYPSNFNDLSTTIAWLNVAGICCSLFLLVSWAFLPKALTHRHYLSVCLAIATILMQLGFIIPLGTKPNFCADDITPHDMHSSLSCALSGAFLLAGGWYGIMWVFMRALSLHLQICWRKTLGREFMYGSLVVGWGVPAVLFVVAFCLTGVSFRFGSTCHINHSNGLGDFWVPLLTLAGATVLIQFSTFGYCVNVYINTLQDKSIMDSASSASGLPSYQHTLQSLNPRQAFIRVKKVLELQWRGMVIVLIIISDVIFFAVEFIKMDSTEQRINKNPEVAITWLACIVASGGETNACLNATKELVISESAIMAVLILLSLNGIWLLLLMFRISMLTGWYELIIHTLPSYFCASTQTPEFISKDALSLHRPSIKPYSPLRPTFVSTTTYDRENCRTLEAVTAPTSPISSRSVKQVEWTSSTMPTPSSPESTTSYPRPIKLIRPATPDYFSVASRRQIPLPVMPNIKRDGLRLHSQGLRRNQDIPDINRHRIDEIDTRGYI